ncbi:MAG: hypothetical protein Q4E56_04325 [Pseudomonadota bacterium]|nr:hypothetical protein [Pseudomonadota bacterium]
MEIQDYKKTYDAATRKVLELASKIDSFALDKFDAEYRLVDIAYVLREKYADPAFRHKYVGNLPFNGFIPWPKGFCALSTICVYELYGGADIWTPSAIHLGDWEHAPVVFLRDNENGIAFDATGDQFAPLRVPYEVGTPINRRIGDMRTPNKAEFVRQIKQELDKR